MTIYLSLLMMQSKSTRIRGCVDAKTVNTGIWPSAGRSSIRLISLSNKSQNGNSGIQNLNLLKTVKFFYFQNFPENLPKWLSSTPLPKDSHRSSATQNWQPVWPPKGDHGNFGRIGWCTERQGSLWSKPRHALTNQPMFASHLHHGNTTTKRTRKKSSKGLTFQV